MFALFACKGGTVYWWVMSNVCFSGKKKIFQMTSSI